MSKTIAVAFAGSGEVRSLTVESLLNDWLGFGPKDAEGFFAASENAVEVFFPASANHFNDNLKKVVDWSAWADLTYTAILQKSDRDDSIEELVTDAETVEEVANVNKALVDALVEAQADEKYLVLLWGEEGDEDCETLVDLAELKGIPVKDLTEGLDDIRFVDPEPEEEPEPEPEPKPARGRRGRSAEEEPEQPKRGSRRGRTEPAETEEEPLTDEDLDTPAEEPVEEVAEAPAAPVAEEKSWGEAGAGHVGSDLGMVAAVVGVALRYHKALDDSDAARRGLGRHEVEASWLTKSLEKALEALNGGRITEKPSDPGEAVSEAHSAPVEAEKPRRGRPRINEPKEGYLLNEEQGTYRKAGRGRPRRGETKVDLTAAEVQRLAEMGVLDPD